MAWMVASIVPAMVVKADTPPGEPRFLIESILVEDDHRPALRRLERLLGYSEAT